MIGELNDLIGILKELGVPEWLLHEVIVILFLSGALFTIGKLIWKTISFIVLKLNQRLLNNDLEPYYSKGDVERATHYFIPSKFQNVAPSEDEEPGRKYIASAKENLIPLFINKAFKNDKDDNKYYLILADTGMGKTTFLINLYLRYKNKITNIFFPPKYDIALFPLGAPNVLQKIELLQDKTNTILLLDAFDEDVIAINNHKERMEEILSKVWEFRDIVLTCRTQFFPSEEEEPDRTGYYTFGEGGEYKFQKLYLSVFDDKDVDIYLRKRFSVFEYKKYIRARKIVKKCPNLVVRPMLLNHIKDLLDSKKDFEHSFEIYKLLINKWIKREAAKPGIREKYGNSETYQKLLFSFSKALARDLYHNRSKRGGYFISKDDVLEYESELQISDIELLSMSDVEKRSRSLLNRNAHGQYKFSHKSILEFFLAEEMLHNKQLLASFNFDGMDAARNFLNEMVIIEIRQLKGEYSIEDNKTQPLSQLNIEDYNKIKKLKISELASFDLLKLSNLNWLEELILVDRSKLSILHEIYLLILDLSVADRTLRKVSNPVFKEEEMDRSKTKRRIFQRIKEVLNKEGLIELQERLEFRNQDMLTGLIHNEKPGEFKEKKIQTTITYRLQRIKIEIQHTNSIIGLYEKLKRSEQKLQDIQEQIRRRENLMGILEHQQGNKQRIEELERLKLKEKKDRLEWIQFQGQQELVEREEYQKISERVRGAGLSFTQDELETLSQLQKTIMIREVLNALEIEDPLKLKKLRTSTMFEEKKFIADLHTLNNFVKQANALQVKLTSCKIYF